MTKQGMSEKILNFAEHYGNAFIVGHYKNKELIYANVAAKKLFGITLATKNLDDLFSNDGIKLMKMVTEGLQTKELVTHNDLQVVDVTGEVLSCNVQYGFFDTEKTEIFIEITPMPDKRMEMAMAQVNQSIRAEAILNYDETLSIVHCNNLFYKVFEANEEIRHSHYGNDLSNGFQPEIREELLKDIQENLKKSTHFHTKMKVITSKGETFWYSLELHKKTLDNSGTDKIMAYLVNVEKEIEKEAEFEEINQYFNILQSMSKGILYRFDIHNKILYRNQESSKPYDVPMITENFPNKEWLATLMHPDDLEATVAYATSLLTGKEGTFTARMRLANGTYEYHNFTFKPIRRPDGSVKEMIGCTINVHKLMETENELDTINQYFSAIQTLSNDMLYLVDIDSKTLRRTTEQASLMGIPEVLPNYPDSVCDSGLLHPDDVEIYRDYGNILLQGKSAQTEVRMKLKNGDYAYHKLFCTPITKSDGTVKEMFGKVLNVQKEKNLVEQANFDALTCVLNKRAISDITSEMLKASEPTCKHALFFMDLDNFKGANDNLGHVFGDFLLQELGKRLKDSVRQQDLVGRVGGDEFIIFLRDVPSVEILMGKAKMLLSTISEDFADGENRHSINGSLGVAMFPDHGTTYEELYHHADIALYHSKNKGKNMVTMFSDELAKDKN